MDEDYNFYEEDVNQVSWPKILFVIILIVVALVSYFEYKKFIKNKEESAPDYSISITDPLVQELYKRYNVFTQAVSDRSVRLEETLYGYYYIDDHYTSKTISSEAKLLTALNELFNNGTLKDEEGNEEPLEIKGEVIRNTISDLFGNDASYEDQSIDEEKAYFCNRGKIIYDQELDVYRTEGEYNCNTTNVPIIQNKIVSAEQKDDTITIVDTMAYLVPEKDEEGMMQYQVYDMLEENDLSYIDTISTLSEFAFYNYKHLHQYQYTYKKQGNHYYLTAVERIKQCKKQIEGNL